MRAKLVPDPPHTISHERLEYCAASCVAVTVFAVICEPVTLAHVPAAAELIAVITWLVQVVPVMFRSALTTGLTVTADMLELIAPT